jgi:hypothetical protein
MEAMGAHILTAEAAMTSEREHWRAAIHEAGHVISCWALNIRIETVEIFQRGGGSIRSGYCTSPTSYEEAHHALIMLYSGAAAERHAFDTVELAADDRADIDAIFFPICLSPETERTWRKRARRDARKLVRANWQRVEAVAGALMQEGKITGGDVVRLLGPAYVINTPSDVRHHDGKIDGTKDKRTATARKRKRVLQVIKNGNELLGEAIRRGGAYEAIRFDGERRVSVGTFADFGAAARAV